MKRNIGARLRGKGEEEKRKEKYYFITFAHIVTLQRHRKQGGWEHIGGTAPPPTSINMGSAYNRKEGSSTSYIPFAELYFYCGLDCGY